MRACCRSPWHWSRSPASSGVDRSIKAGSYEVEQGTTLPRLLARLTQGDVTQTSLVIVEGADVRRDASALMRSHADVKNTLLDLPDDALMARLGAPGVAPEGQFFPDTYFFAAGSHGCGDPRARARRPWTGVSRRRGSSARRDLPFKTPYEALIVASIVEKETGKRGRSPADRVGLRQSRCARECGCRPIRRSIYGMGERFDGNLRRRDLETDTPYNTYTRDGLPPTPIALPSQASLDATLNPPATEYLYFVARGDGTSQFSTTLVEHNRAVVAVPERWHDDGHTAQASHDDEGRAMTATRGRFVTLEGIDGAGKSTHVAWLADALAAARPAGRGHARARRHAARRAPARPAAARADDARVARRCSCSPRGASISSR